MPIFYFTYCVRITYLEVNKTYSVGSWQSVNKLIIMHVDLSVMCASGLTYQHK